MTELQKLKAKKKAGKATAEDLTRLKQLQDGEPLSAKDLKVARQREKDRVKADKEAFEARHAATAKPLEVNESDGATPKQETDALDIPPDHPRIVELKQALMPFTQIEAHASRPDEFVLITRGISITAGDVRKARKAMKL